MLHLIYTTSSHGYLTYNSYLAYASLTLTLSSTTILFYSFVLDFLGFNPGSQILGVEFERNTSPLVDDLYFLE